MTTYQTENKEQRLMIIIVLGQIYRFINWSSTRVNSWSTSFYIFLGDLSFVVKYIDIASYADDSTPFMVENNIDNVIASLEQVSDALFSWFKYNRLKNNFDKCHVLVSTN